MNQTNTHKIFSKISPNIDYENFRFLISGKLATSLILKYLIKKHDIDYKLSEILVPKLMGTWVYSSILQNIQAGTMFSEHTKILYLYHQFGIPQKHEVKKFAEENNLLIIEDCAHVLKANLINKKSDILTSEYSIFSFSKFIDCQPLGGLNSSDKKFIAFVDEEINNSGRFQSMIIDILVKLSKVSKSNELLSRKFYHMNYSLWNFPSKNIKSKIRNFKQNISNEINSRNINFNLYKNEIKDIYYQDYFMYDELVCQKLPLVIKNKKIMKKIIDKFEHYQFPFEILTYDKNRNFLDPQFEKTIILDPSSFNTLFEKQIELIRDSRQ
jgi:hypothetical protein